MIAKIHRAMSSWLFRLMASFVAMLMLCSCAGDLDGASNSQVEDLFFDDDSIGVGEGSVLRVRFSFSGINSLDDIFDTADNVVVVVRVPAELRFRAGTAEVQTGGEDERVGASVFDCETGEQYLMFDLDEDDLEDARNPGGDGDVELALTLDALSVSESAIVQASARNNSLFFECGTEFNRDRQAVLTILP